jgi:hypothetical protein
MKKIYLILAAMMLVSLSLNAQLKATKDGTVVYPKTSTLSVDVKDVTPPDGYFRMGPSRASTTTVTPPYSNNFSSSEWDWWEVIDNNNGGSGDGKTWTYDSSNQRAVYSYHGSNAADDWLVTAPIHLIAGKTYKFYIDASRRSPSYMERLEVKLASSNTATALSAGTSIIAATDVTPVSPTYTTFQNENVTVSTTGDYYFGIHAISIADRWELYVDNLVIDVDAALDHDLAISLSAPTQAGAGSTVRVTASITNNGSNAESGYTVTFQAGGVTFDTQTANTSLAAGASTTFTAQYTTTAAQSGQAINFSATVACANDADATNNSASASTSLITLPPPENVAAMADDEQTATMTWDAPSVFPMFPGSVTEDFEDTEVFPPYSVGGITSTQHTGAFGEWTLYDPSGANVFSDQSLTWENEGAPHAWQAFPASTFSMNAHSGDQFMLSIDCVTSGGNTNHWLISPELTGEAQTISFYAAEITTSYGSETYEIWVSTTDNNPSSFTQLGNSHSVSTTDWSLQSISLPAGTKYFAIRHTSYDIYGMMIDDVTYKAFVPTPPESYNIYLDGTLVGNVNSDVFSYNFINLSTGQHNCGVSAVYPGNMESAVVTVPIPEFAPITSGTVSPNSVDLGAVQTGQSSTGTVTVTNTGNQPFTPVIDSTNLPSVFTVTGAQQINAHGSIDLTVTFAPTAETSYSGSFTVTIPVPDGDDIVVTVTVTGSGYVIISSLTSNIVEVPVYKSEAKAPSATYVFSQDDVEGDTDMSLSYGSDADIKVDVLVKDDEPITSYDLRHKVGTGNWASVATATQDASNPKSYVYNNETFVIPSDATQMWLSMTDAGADASSTISYVPVTVANGVVTQGNTYGAPQVQATNDPISFIVSVGGSKSAGRPGGHWDQNGVDYCIYTPVVTIANINPAFDGENRVPYLIRAWLLENENVPFYSIVRVANENDPDNSHIEAGNVLTYPYPLGEMYLESDMISEQYMIGHDWSGEGDDPWNNPWGDVEGFMENVFAAPSTMPTGEHMSIAVRIYYYKPGENVSGSQMLLAANRDGDAPSDGYGYGEGEGNGEGIPTAVVGIYTDRQVVDVKYVNPQGLQSDRPFDGVNIIVTRYNDGSVTTSKVVR